jgi:hypothetical protein
MKHYLKTTITKYGRRQSEVVTNEEYVKYKKTSYYVTMMIECNLFEGSKMAVALNNYKLSYEETKLFIASIWN